MNPIAETDLLPQETSSPGSIETDRSYAAVGAELATRIRYLEGFLKPPPASEPEIDTSDPEVITSMEAFRPQRFVPPTVWTPAPKPAKEAFLALQRWEGIVTECLADSFLARLTDLTSEGPAEEVELSIHDVAPEDRSLVENGAVFYWSIGYRDDASGQRSRASTLRFRRLPVWSVAELEAAKERALDVARVFGGD